MVALFDQYPSEGQAGTEDRSQHPLREKRYPRLPIPFFIRSFPSKRIRFASWHHSRLLFFLHMRECCVVENAAEAIGASWFHSSVIGSQRWKQYDGQVERTGVWGANRVGKTVWSPYGILIIFELCVLIDGDDRGIRIDKWISSSAAKSFRNHTLLSARKYSRRNNFSE